MNLLIYAARKTYSPKHFELKVLSAERHLPILEVSEQQLFRCVFRWVN